VLWGGRRMRSLVGESAGLSFFLGFVTTTRCVGAIWPQILFPPNLQKHTKKDPGKTKTSHYQKF